jgi:TusA-related sulfurtransferase
MQFIYDGSDDECPLSLVKTKVLLKKLQPGQCAIITLRDDSSQDNIRRFLDKYQWCYQIQTIEQGKVQFLIHKQQGI